MELRLNYTLRGVLNLLWVIAVIFGVQTLVHGRLPDLLGQCLACCTVLGAYIAGVHWIERRPVVEFDLRPSPGELAAGVFLGVGLFSALMLLLWVAHICQFSGWGNTGALANGFVFALLAAVSEEILFRGFLFRLIARSLGIWGALAITSLLFGAAHLFNPGATISSALAIALEAGVLLGAAFALTNRLWFPIGIHLGWNFTEGSLFGMSVSGRNAGGSLIQGSLHGPDLLTGGQFGPEASIVAVLLCTTAAGFILRKTVRRDRVLRTGSPDIGTSSR